MAHYCRCRRRWWCKAMQIQIAIQMLPLFYIRWPLPPARPPPCLPVRAISSPTVGKFTFSAVWETVDLCATVKQQTYQTFQSKTASQRCSEARWKVCRHVSVFDITVMSSDSFSFRQKALQAEILSLSQIRWELVPRSHKAYLFWHFACQRLWNDDI